MRVPALFILGSLGLSLSAETILLTHDGTNKRDPRDFDGGRKIMYSFDETRALLRLMVMDAEELKPELMFNDANKISSTPYRPTVTTSPLTNAPAIPWRISPSAGAMTAMTLPETRRPRRLPQSGVYP